MITNRRMLGLYRADLRDRDLEIGQHFQQEGLERLVGTVELVDQQDRRTGDVRLEGLQQGTLDQEALGKDVVPSAITIASPMASASRIAIICRRVVPFIDRCGDVEAFVALQADQPPSEGADRTLAISVLPTPASPSRNNGRPILSARNSTVASSGRRDSRRRPADRAWRRSSPAERAAGRRSSYSWP